MGKDSTVDHPARFMGTSSGEERESPDSLARATFLLAASRMTNPAEAGFRVVLKTGSGRLEYIPLFTRRRETIHYATFLPTKPNNAGTAFSLPRSLAGAGSR